MNKAISLLSFVFLLVSCSENKVTRSNKVYMPPMCLVQSNTYQEAAKENPQTIILANSDCSEMLTYTPSILVEIIPTVIDIKKQCPTETAPTPNPVPNPLDVLAQPAQKSNPKKNQQLGVFRIRMTPLMNPQTKYFELLKTEFPTSKIYLSDVTNGFEILGLPKLTQLKARSKATLSPKLFEGTGAEVVVNQTDYCKTSLKSEWVNSLINELESELQVTHVYMYGKFKIATPVDLSLQKSLLPPTPQTTPPTPNPTNPSASAATAFLRNQPPPHQ